MMLKLSILVILFCSLFWAFQSTKGQFIHNNGQSLRSIFGTDQSFSYLNSINAKILDVQKLNKLISFFDETWILPFPGFHQSIGSNFKRRGTCANVYKTQENACQQVSFGTMCFNYCYEQGEEMKFQCEDVAGSAYCKNNSAFDSFLMQYQNVPYKAKSYIRQMISRCYATAICDTQNGILNTTIIDGDNEQWENVNVASVLNLTADNNNQPEISTVTEIQPIRPISIRQLLLLRNKMIAESKSIPIKKTTENNGLTEVVNEESLKKFGNTEITEENNSKEVENTAQYTTEKTAAKKATAKQDRKEAQTIEQLRLLYKALQGMDKSADCFGHL